MEITEQLKKLGLNQSECTVYLFLLKSGPSFPPDVSRETDIARTNCYNIFNTLLEKGLISEQIDGKRRSYSANSPDSILEMLDRQKNDAIKILPDLKAMYAAEQNKPAITFYSGWEKIREIFYQTYQSEQVLFIGNLELFKPVSEFFHFYKEELVKRNISFEAVVTADNKNVPPETAGSMLISGFSINNPNFPTSILLWGNNVAFITDSGLPFATVLQNNAISGSFYTLFKVLKGV